MKMMMMMRYGIFPIYLSHYQRLYYAMRLLPEHCMWAPLYSLTTYTKSIKNSLNAKYSQFIFFPLSRPASSHILWRAQRLSHRKLSKFSFKVFVFQFETVENANNCHNFSVCCHVIVVALVPCCVCVYWMFVVCFAYRIVDFLFIRPKHLSSPFFSPVPKLVQCGWLARHRFSFYFRWCLVDGVAWEAENFIITKFK